ncbi:sensor histidine kinase [Streptacidiphilus monticola]|uniref:histidine kinase n=1 Tax=Streptacidiphilus monticola TaxID=2161674 RepID=A0ABW1FSY3_9ACTN
MSSATPAAPVLTGSRPVPRTRPAFDRRMLREAGHLLSNLAVGIAGFTLTVAGISAGVGLLFTIVGIWVLAPTLFVLRSGLGSLERRRLLALLDEEVPAPLPVAARRDNVLSRALAVLGDGLAWRTVLYFCLMLPWGVLTFTLTLVALVTLFPLLPWITRGLSTVDRVLATTLLAQGDLTRRVRKLEQDRGSVVDTAAADLRRIERDLHDGAQARLVAVAMDLGLAKEKLTEDPEAAARMVDTAHGEVKVALQELRDLARGIHPAVLTDRGLDPALSAVAARVRVPGGARVTVDLDERPDPAIEGIAYFTVSELLANVSKHARAQRATVDVWRSGDRVLIQVQDDGVGGATAAPGGGIAGLAERVRAVDGVFDITSPVGGPTTVNVELPWHTR